MGYACMKYIAVDDRATVLREARFAKMALSVHAYVRGNTARFYEWLALSDAGPLVPQGPPVWICGDCHLGNLGPLADSEGRVDILIRDLDQTVIGNPALDLIRLGLSLQTAARSSDFSGVAIARMMDAMADAYLDALVHAEDDAPPEPDVVRTVRRRARSRRWRQLAEERIGDTDPSIPLGKNYWPVDVAERVAVESLFKDKRVRHRVLALTGVDGDGKVRLVDMAYWKKGCSSLGLLRYAALVAVRAKGSKDEKLALVDIKEAVAPLAPIAPGTVMPLDNAERVVAGARALSPHLGDRMIAVRALGRSFFLRELKPQDLKLEIGQFSQSEGFRAATYLAYVVGRSHALQMDSDSRAAWHETLTHHAAVEPGAPSWLWSAIVDLAGWHERGYLEHCRALG